MKYQYQSETLAQLEKLADQSPKTVSLQSHSIGMDRHEPLIVMLDAAIRYAKAHETRFESKLADDSFLGDEWLSIVKGVRGLLIGNGAIANEIDRATDSKDNGACEGMFWDAMKIAGFTEDDL